MTLAKGASPRAILSRLALIMIGSGLLAGCQSAGHVPPPEARADAWRVIERVGEARYLAPGASSWAAALSATDLPDGSRVTTGVGGRLILGRAADQVSAGPDSDFSLPDTTSGAVLKQTDGRLRYRLAGPPPFTIAAPGLVLEPRGSVFDVTVGADGTEVAVERGQLRAAAPDRREIELEAGQSARAGGREALALRRARGQPLEQAPRIVRPALQPRPAVAEGAQLGSSLTVVAAATDQAATSAAASVESAVPVATARPPVGAAEQVAPAARAALSAITEGSSATMGRVAPRPGRPAMDGRPPVAAVAGVNPTAGRDSTRPPAGAAEQVAPAARAALPAVTEGNSATMDSVAPGPGRPAADDTPPVAPVPGPNPPADGDSTIAPAPDEDSSAEASGDDRRLLFDRLTEGMIDAVPVQPARREPSAHGRSI
jgi:hypothetical protein